MFALLIFIFVNIVFILFYLQVEPVFLPACLNKAIQITSCVINIGNNVCKISSCCKKLDEGSHSLAGFSNYVAKTMIDRYEYLCTNDPCLPCGRL